MFLKQNFFFNYYNKPRSDLNELINRPGIRFLYKFLWQAAYFIYISTAVDKFKSILI